MSRFVAERYVQRSRYYKELANQEADDTQAREYMERAKKFNSSMLKLKMATFKDSVIKEMSEMFYEPRFLQQLDMKETLLCFENGVFDLDLHEFRPGNPEDYLTMTTGYDFVEHEDEIIQTDIMGFMDSIMPNTEMREYLLKVVAYMLTGDKYLEQLWFYTGRGRNGKGTVCNLMKVTYGEYYYEPDIAIVTTTKKSSGAASPELIKAKGKRVMVASEPDDEDKDSKFRVNRLKQLRGNDLVQARGLYKEFIEYKPQFGMIFQMNDKPELSKLDEAIAKSLKIIEFPYQFVFNPVEGNRQKQIDTTLKHKFEDVRYRQQFMRMLLRYHAAYIRGNKALDDPVEVVRATDEYMKDNNPVRLWLEDN